MTRLGSTTHFYLRAALKYAGLNPEKDVTILQLGTEYAAALETGRIAAAALPFDLALPYLQKGWPVLLDLSKTDFVYPASCVVSSRAFVKDNPDTVERFLKAYIEAIHLMKKDHGAGERAYNKWLKPKDPLLAKKAVEAYANLFKPIPRVTDRGIQAVLEDLALSTAGAEGSHRSSGLFSRQWAVGKNGRQRLDRSAREIVAEILFTAKRTRTENSKHEIRNPKQIRMFKKTHNSKQLKFGFGVLGFSSVLGLFGCRFVRSAEFFRASNFGVCFAGVLAR